MIASASSSQAGRGIDRPGKDGFGHIDFQRQRFLVGRLSETIQGEGLEEVATLFTPDTILR